MRVIYSEPFRAELCCITGRYSAEDKDLGRRFVQTVEQAVLEIQSAPLRWRVLEGRVRRRLVSRFPYIIYYLIDEDVLYFGALLHSARHPETYRQHFPDL